MVGRKESDKREVFQKSRKTERTLKKRGIKEREFKRLLKKMRKGLKEDLERKIGKIGKKMDERK